MTVTRRSFLRNSAAVAAAGAAGLELPAMAANAVTDAELNNLNWSKAPCRFCGTGCGVMVGVKEGKVVATQGDPRAEVNREIGRAHV